VVITRQTDFDARELVSKDAVHLGQRTDFNLRQKASGEMSVSPAGLRAALLPLLPLLEAAPSCVFEKRIAGRREFNAVALRFIS
jgi:hypothetical protein